MNKAKENRIKYEILENIIDRLDEQIKSYEDSSETYKKRAMDEETGEVNTSGWEWMNHIDYEDRIEVTLKLKQMFEKL